MALDNETKSPSVEVYDDAENIKTGKEPKVENLTEKIEDQKAAEKREIAETVAEIIEKNVDEAVVAKEPVASVVEMKHEETNVTEEINKEKDQAVSVKEPVVVLADEDAMMKEAEIIEKSKDECVKETFVPLTMDECATDIENDDEVSADNGKQGTMENRGTHETTTKTTDPEKPTVENVKGESKEEKTVDEAKLKESKQEDITSPKQSITLIGKVKKSFMKAKKAITFTGKNNTNTKNPETKEDEKA